MQLRDAAETLGVHYQTAYGWVRQGTLRARKTPHGYEVSESDVRDLLARRAAGAEPPREVQVRDWAAQADRLYAALVAGDETQARHDFGRLAHGGQRNDQSRNHAHGAGYRSRRKVSVRSQPGIERHFGVYDWHGWSLDGHTRFAIYHDSSRTFVSERYAAGRGCG